MAKPNQVQDSAVEAILASVRQMMAAEDRGPLAAVAGIASPASSAPDAGLVLARPRSGVDPDAGPASYAVIAAPAEVQEAGRGLAKPLLPAEPEAAVEVPVADSYVGAATTAIDRLSTSILPGGSRAVAERVEEMLRPLLRQWLDDNLPLIVERLVREEIERVSRGRF
jgi:hypothetical protein